MEIGSSQISTRLALIIVVGFVTNDIGPNETALFSKIQRNSDSILTMGKGNSSKGTKYDYIIIGGGTAGAVLAKRLTESGKSTVLLLEAGGDPNPVSDIPMAYRQIVYQSDMVAKYMSVPQSDSCLGNKGMCRFQRGIALGGTSSVNGLYYNRCNPKDYDAWANFTNDPIWRFENVVDAFKAVESYHGFYENITETVLSKSQGKNHGTDGEINIGRMEYQPGADTFFKAVAEKGYPIGDLNSFESQYGFSRMDRNIKDGLRWSTYHGFIQPILGRKNLKIFRYSKATMIHLDNRQRAKGVTYTRHGKIQYAGANKEVIVAAGVIDSPKLLMLSGIGPKNQLKKLGISPKLNLGSVGAYLQEHIGIKLPNFSLNTSFGINNVTTPENIYQYINNGSGPLLGISYLDPFATRFAGGYISTKTNKDPSWPDIQVYINRQVLETVGKPSKETFIVQLTLVKTDQTGSVQLASSNPDDYPLIDPQFFQNSLDLEKIIDGIEEMVDFFLNSPTYKELGIKWSDKDPRIPECGKFVFGTRDYWRCFVPIMSDSEYHPTSTCRMGPNNSVAVVDSRLRVFGATGLRIVDASVMPFVPNGNTNFPSIMVGEMGARIILNTI